MNHNADAKPPIEKLTVFGELPTDLPPVEPPSAGFIVQLFVIPAVIVAVVIVVWLLFGKLAGGERDVMWYVETLKSSDANYRSAYELGSLIRNDPQVASDGKLLGELTELLDRDLDGKTEERLLVYLTAALGAFNTLDATTVSGKTVYPLQVLSKALADGRPNEVRKAAGVSIAAHAARMKGALTDEATVKALVATKTADAADVRKVATFALGFFGGTPALEGLTAALNDPDRDVRYNAAAALGRRGALAGKGFLKEMLTTSDLESTLKEVAEAERRNQIESIEVVALESVRKGLQDGHYELAQQLKPELEDLTRSGLVSVRTLAQEVLKILQEKAVAPQLPPDAVKVGKASESAATPAPAVK